MDIIVAGADMDAPPLVAVALRRGSCLHVGAGPHINRVVCMPAGRPGAWPDVTYLHTGTVLLPWFGDYILGIAIPNDITN